MSTRPSGRAYVALSVTDHRLLTVSHLPRLRLAVRGSAENRAEVLEQRVLEFEPGKSALQDVRHLVGKCGNPSDGQGLPIKLELRRSWRPK
jgi:hypothetical protein